jgi:hypothetical protein
MVDFWIIRYGAANVVYHHPGGKYIVPIFWPKSCPPSKSPSHHTHHSYKNPLHHHYAFIPTIPQPPAYATTNRTASSTTSSSNEPLFVLRTCRSALAPATANVATLPALAAGSRHRRATSAVYASESAARWRMRGAGAGAAAVANAAAAAAVTAVRRREVPGVFSVLAGLAGLGARGVRGGREAVLGGGDGFGVEAARWVFRSGMPS